MLKDKLKSLIGIDEDDFFDEEFEVPAMEAPVAHSNVQPVTHSNVTQVAPSNVAQVETFRQPLRAVETPRQMPQQQQPQNIQHNNNRGQVMAMNANAMMSKVIIREPKDYSDAQNIADCLKESLPVFVNLQRLDKGQGRRVIDFLSGCIYAVDGDIQRVGNDLFLCTPRSVETDGSVTETNDELSLGEL